MADLLKHLPEYRVVICLPCQFAVQPQALSSHLLRHKVYREKRRQLLAWLSKLDLAEPEVVSRPSRFSAPIQGLPVYNGSVCLAEGCSYGGTSDKRMSQHWSSEHDEHDSKKVKSRPATIQTFFRGNKTSFFEIASKGVNGEGGLAAMGDTAYNLPSLLSRDIHSELIHPALQLPDLDIDPLRYFHHFMVSPHLQGRRDELESDVFWRETIPQEALRHPFLMNAILSFAATHLAVISQNDDDCQRHYKLAMQYQLASIRGFQTTIQHPQTSNSIALIATARFVGPQRLVQFQIEQSKSTASVTAADGVDHVVETLSMLRGVAKLSLEMQPLLPKDADFVMDADSIHAITSFATEPQTAYPIPGPPQIALLETFDALKQHVDQIQDVTADEYRALLTAISALQHSVHLCYASESRTALWNGIESWPYLVPDEFVAMLKRAHPVALVVYAHFCPMLRRGEGHYWFLKDQAKNLINIVRTSIGPEYVSLMSGLDEILQSPR